MYLFGIEMPVTAIFLIIFILQIIILIELVILWRRHDRRRN
jgi:hypothetical protein